MSDSSKGSAPAPANYSDIVADGGMDPRSEHVEQQLPSTSPSEWQSVPVNPTIEMIAALGFNGDVVLAVGHASACEELTAQYRAMLACAPAASLEITPTASLGLVEALQSAHAVTSHSGSGKFALTLSFDNLAAMQACRRAVLSTKEVSNGTATNTSA